MVRPSGAERMEARRARGERHASETDPSIVIKAAARYLEQRSRSVSEVRRHLTEAQYPEALVTQAVDRLVDLGILDDQAFATAWVESRDRARPRGTSALRRELALKGLDREVIEETLAGRRTAGEAARDEPDDDVSYRSPDERAAERLLSKSRMSLERVADPRARRQRAYALLARNGFDPEICRVVSGRAASFDEESPE
jgi:regulatory protein